MEFRTDLALEYTEPGSQKVEQKKNCTITRIKENGADYVTLEVPAISDHLDSNNDLSVSYTHLTLPTNSRV